MKVKTIFILVLATILITSLTGCSIQDILNRNRGKVFLNVTIYPQGSGTVTPNNCYVNKGYVTLTAVPNSGYVFEEWQGMSVMNQYDNPTTIYLDDYNNDVTAWFQESIGEVDAGTVNYYGDNSYIGFNKTFYSTPTVIVSAKYYNSGAITNYPLIASAGNVGSYGFTLYLHDLNGNSVTANLENVTVSWVAFSPQNNLIQAGQRTITGNSTIYFDNSFTYTPVVICSARKSDGTNEPLIANPTTVYNNSFNISLKDYSGNSATGCVDFIALNSTGGLAMYSGVDIVASNQYYQYNNSYISFGSNMNATPEAVVCSSNNGAAFAYNTSYSGFDALLQNSPVTLGYLAVDTK